MYEAVNLVVVNILHISVDVDKLTISGMLNNIYLFSRIYLSVINI